jgi:hypothetical protein
MKSLTKKIKTLKTQYSLLDAKVSRLEKKTKKLILGGLAMMTFANVSCAADSKTVCSGLDWSNEKQVELCYETFKNEKPCDNVNWDDDKAIKRCWAFMDIEDKWEYGTADGVFEGRLEQTNEEYCEEIYWEDFHNCIYPEQDVTQKMCETEYFDQAQEICFKMLKKQRKHENQN